MADEQPEIYLSDLRWGDGFDLYSLALHPQFFYRALNSNNAWVAWRALRYILKAKYDANRVVKAIRLKASDKLIGCVLLSNFNKPLQGQSETETFIAVPYQRKCIGTTARMRFLDWSLNKFPELQAIETMAHPDNIASINMQKRSGMKPIKIIPAEDGNYLGRDGKLEPRVIMRATRPEIEAALALARAQNLYSRDMLVL